MYTTSFEYPAARIYRARCGEYFNSRATLIGRVVREQKLVIVEDVRTEKLYRYPELARKAGLASLLSVPLLTSQGVIGTLNIYLKYRRIFTKEETLFAQALAGHAAMALENARLISESLEMKRTLEVRKIVERAKGILQQREGLSEEEAYLHLRSESRRMRRPMRNLAEAIILAEELHRKSRRKEVGDLSELPEHSLKGLEDVETAFDEDFRN